MDCPKCGLVNPASAGRCDCGYDFTTKKMETSYLNDGDPTIVQRRWVAGRVNVVANLYLCIGGGWLLLCIVLALVAAVQGERAGVRLSDVAVIGILFIPMFCIGVGLKRLRPWGRTTALIFAVLTIFSPISWYVLWVLTRPQCKELFILDCAR